MTDREFSSDSHGVYPKLTVVTPSFNQGQFLEECILSVLEQNYPCLEYIVMDGGSTDCSVEIIKKYARHLHYWQSKPDGGQYTALQYAFQRSSGQIMAWINADDHYHPGAFHIAAHALALRGDDDASKRNGGGQGLSLSGIGPPLWIVGHPTFWVPGKTQCQIDPTIRHWNRHHLIYQPLDPCVQQESTFWTRTLWNRAGGAFNLDYKLAGDMDLWVRFSRHAPLHSVQARLGGFRFHEAQKTATSLQAYYEEAYKIVGRERVFDECNGRAANVFPPLIEIRLDGERIDPFQEPPTALACPSDDFSRRMTAVFASEPAVLPAAA